MWGGGDESSVLVLSCDAEWSIVGQDIVWDNSIEDEEEC